MKIDQRKRNLEGFAGVSKAGQIGVRKGSVATFDQELAHKRQADNHTRMQELLEKIDDMNDKLSRTLTIGDLIHYKALVKKFLGIAVNSAYAIQHERGRNRRGRTMLVTINVIDEEVEKVIEDFVGQKKDPMEILGTLDRIRGMLIDLMA